VLRVITGPENYVERQIRINTDPYPDNYPPQIPTPVGPVDNVVFECSPSVALKWMPVEDNDGILRYEWVLERSQGGQDGPYTVVRSGRSTEIRVVVPVTCGLWHRWRVRALDGWGTPSQYSNYEYFAIGLE
jgi:hypothetical protein